MFRIQRNVEKDEAMFLCPNREDEVTILIKSYANWTPKFIMTDFSKSLMNSVKNQLILHDEEAKIVPCFFHFCQCLWRKASSLGLRKKDLVKRTKLVILNLKALCFRKTEKVEYYFQKIQTVFTLGESAYKPLFRYFEKNWIKGKICSPNVWNYSKYITVKNNKYSLSSKCHFTNSNLEKVNGLLNYYTGNVKTIIEKFNIVLNQLMGFYDSNTIDVDLHEKIEPSYKSTDLMIKLCHIEKEIIEEEDVKEIISRLRENIYVNEEENYAYTLNFN